MDENTKSKLEKLDSLQNFERRLRKKDYSSSIEISIELSKFLYELIKNTIENKLITTQEQLLDLIRYFGKIFIQIDPIQFSIGNIVKRILFIIRDEIDNLTSFRDVKIDEEANIKRLKAITSLNRLIDYRNIRTIEKRKSSTMENNEEDNKTKKSEDLNQGALSNDLIDNILRNIEELIGELEGVSDAIKDQADEHINDNDIILTANHSDQLEELFIEASKTKKFKVYVTESAPSLSGLIQAKILKKNNIDVTVIQDSAVYAIMPKVNKIIIGTRAIMANGGLVTYNGVYNLCLCAQIFSVPVVVVGGTFKLTPMFPFNHETFNDFLSPDSILSNKLEYKGDISNIKFNTPAFDYVPPEMITIYITNQGSQNPAYIYRLFSELYSQEDYFL
jgi:translation initiation factor eIF-2B subunit beta